MSCRNDTVGSFTPLNKKNNHDSANREGKIIGRFDGNWLRDGIGRLVARYDKWDNRTRTREGKIVGDGDQRMRELRAGCDV